MLKDTSWTFEVPFPELTIDVELSSLSVIYLPAALDTVVAEISNRAPFPEDENSVLYVFLHISEKARSNHPEITLVQHLLMLKKHLGSVNGWSLDRTQMALDSDRPWRQLLRLHMSTLYDLAT